MAQPGIEQVVDVPKFVKFYVPDLPSDAIIDEVELLDEELGDSDDDETESVTANMLWNVAHAHR
jgi:hypothetical protein